MCGIWAIIGYDGDTMSLMNCFQKIADRGPDCYRIENINHYKDCCLGFHRLSIVGDLYGMQPIRIKEKPHLSLICNGEIYNFKNLIKECNLDPTTHCDIESMVHLYAKLGAIRMTQMLDGVFSCFIMDTLQMKIFLIRDRHGVRPLKYILTEKGFLGVCSEAKGLIDIIPNIPHEKEVQIKVLGPGMILEFDLLNNGTVNTNFKTYKYAKIGITPLYKSITMPDPNLDIYENIRRLLKAAVSKRLQSERRIGCLLSGGLDSSLIAGLLVKCMKEANLNYQLQTFSIGMGDDSVDILAARKVAKYLGTQHFEVTFSLEDSINILPELIYRLETFDTTTIRASVGMYLVSKFIRKNTNTTVLFSGEGSDELTGGYIYFHKAPNSQMFHDECLRLLNNLCFFDIRRADRTISSCGLEARVPFLDSQFTSYYLNIDKELRIPKDGIEKWLLRKSFSNQGLIPEDIIWRPKEAFSDGVSQESKKSFFELLQDHFSTQITDNDLTKASEMYPRLPPTTKETYYYRKTFEKYFPNQNDLTPYYWMPSFVDAKDPSARNLSHYKSSVTKGS